MGVARPERLGVFGGTFDPVHVGHLVAAVNARHALALDRVLMVVANQPWQKSDRVVAAVEDRLEMLEAAVEGLKGLEVSRMEVDRGGESLTADTLEELSAVDPAPELFLVVGADVAAALSTWRREDVARRLATLVVVDRPGAAVLEPSGGWRVERVAIPHLDVSSSDLRRRVAAGLPLDFLVPSAALALLRHKGLYAVPR